MGAEIEIITDEQRLRPEKSEVERLLADNRLAEQLLGWRPHVSLEDGLVATIDWVSRNIGHYRPAAYAI